jgi:phenylalanyl-tRNA synthetase beta chain
MMVLEPERAYGAAKGLLDGIARELNVELQVKPAALTAYAAGRSGEVWLGDVKIGTIGQLHPSRLKAMKLEGEAAYFEVELTPLMEASGTREYVVPSAFPTTLRDLALLVPVTVTWQELREAAANWDVNFVDDYYGAELPENMKSITIRLRLSLPDRTPTEAEASDLEEAVLTALKRKLGAQRRA